MDPGRGGGLWGHGALSIDGTRRACGALMLSYRFTWGWGLRLPPVSGSGSERELTSDGRSSVTRASNFGLLTGLGSAVP